MKLPRRQFLHLVAGAAALPAMSRLARAQAYPARPVRLLIGFAPGGTQDVIGRLLGQWLTERLGQQFIIENRPGAASNIAAEAAIRSPPFKAILIQCECDPRPMRSGNVPVLLEAAQRWLDFAPGEFVTAPCKRIAINFAAKRSRTTQFQIYSVKLCPQGPEGAPCGIDCRTRRLALLVRSTHLTTAIHRRRNNISAGRAGRRW